MKIISEIKDLIKQANQAQDINTLIDLNMRISGLLLYLCEEETEACKTYLEAYNARKYFESEYVIKSALGVTKAENMAAVESRTLKQEETTAEIIYNRIKSFRFQANEFSGVLTQKIANLRREIEKAALQHG